MVKSAFLDHDIRAGLIEICDNTVKRCSEDVYKLLPRKQGLEGIFQKAFLSCQSKAYPNWDAKEECDRRSLPSKNPRRERGRVDMILTCKDLVGAGERIGIEFKVCQLPRMQWNSPKSATYDVGQIVYDYYDLSKYDLNYAYCIALVHGAISSIPEATAKGVARSFHNALFTDFQSAREWGDMKFSRLELRTYRDMGLDKPYCERAANPNNFCRLYRREKLAVVGICVNRLD